jgi:hypothetical protein
VTTVPAGTDVHRRSASGSKRRATQTAGRARSQRFARPVSRRSGATPLVAVLSGRLSASTSSPATHSGTPALIMSGGHHVETRLLADGHAQAAPGCFLVHTLLRKIKRRQKIGVTDSAMSATGSTLLPAQIVVVRVGQSQPSGRGRGIAPSASLIRVQTFMLTTTPTISRISSGLKFSASASWKRWNAASRSVSAARVSASA